MVEYYDIYVDNCFYRRIHYFGLVQDIEKKLRDKGHIVRIEAGYEQ